MSYRETMSQVGGGALCTWIRTPLAKSALLPGSLSPQAQPHSDLRNLKVRKRVSQSPHAPFSQGTFCRPPKAEKEQISRSSCEENPWCPLFSSVGKLQGHTNGAWLRGSCFWAQNYRSHHSLTFNQRVLIRGRGASQHSQLWPDLVNPLLLNLERGVVRRWGQREKSSPMQSLGSSGAHQLASVQACSAQASRPPLELDPRQSLCGSHMRVPPPSHCGSSG